MERTPALRYIRRSLYERPLFNMEEEWASDGLDEALASVCELVEDKSKELTIDLSEDSDYFDWRRDWETQNVNNGLFNDSSNPSLVGLSGGVDSDIQPGQQLPPSGLSTNCGSTIGSTDVPDCRIASGESLELSSSVRAPFTSKATTPGGRTDNIPHSAPATFKRRILAELHQSNKRFCETDGQAEIPKKEESVGRTPANRLLSAHKAVQIRW